MLYTPYYKSSLIHSINKAVIQNTMKIGILTVPFNNNYGGFLQAFALKQVLLDLGHEVIFINRRRNQSKKTQLLLFFCEEESLITLKIISKLLLFLYNIILSFFKSF